MIDKTAMMEKFASYNRLADKGMHLISRISQMNESVKGILDDTSEEYLQSVNVVAKELELAIEEYKSTVVDSFSKIASLEPLEETEINAVGNENGYKL